MDDARVRSTAFDWLTEQVDVHGDVLPRTLLADGFNLDGERIPLVAPQGIFKPRVLEVPLSITSAPKGPYDDRFGPDGLLRYRYRGQDPSHRDNRGLRSAMHKKVPLVYLFGIAPGKYLAAWPVYIVGDDPASLEFTVAIDDANQADYFPAEGEVHENEQAIRRLYRTTTVRYRVHQRAFRERVLDAYRRECAFCHFRHDELLDAAHIAGDATPEGEPQVSNGLALCRLHHGAFDKHFVGLRPDLTLSVRKDLLIEIDGPTLVHGIQALDGQRIRVPRRSEHKPNLELVATRFAEFVARAAKAS